MGDIIFIGKSAADHVKPILNSTVIVIPWLFLSLLMEVILVLSPIAGSMDIFSVSAIRYPGTLYYCRRCFCPVFIVRIWDCLPLEDTN